MYNVRIFRLVTALPNYGQDTHDALRVHADLSSFFTCLLQTIRKLITVALSSAIDLAVMLNSGIQARSQSGAPATDLDAPTRKLQNIRDKHADQPAKDVPHLTASTCCLLNLRGCKQLTVKNVCIYRVFCVMLQSALCDVTERTV